MKAVDTATSRNLDQQTIQKGTPGLVLMERAGNGAAGYIHSLLTGPLRGHIDKVLVCCGKGNNGGDGFVIARSLKEKGWDVTVITTHPITSLSRDAQVNALRIRHRLPLCEAEPLPDRWLKPRTLVVDALLGTGIKGKLRAPFPNWIQAINDSGLPVVAVDVPSGLNSDTGEIDDMAVLADVTITFGLPKTGLFLKQGTRCAGRVEIVEIGLDAEAVRKAPSPFNVIYGKEVQMLLRRLPATLHKVSAGRIVVVGGSRQYPGAPVLTAEAALNSGAGLVYLARPAGVKGLGPAHSAAIIPISVPDHETGTHHIDGFYALHPVIASASAIAIGPGLGRAPQLRPFLDALLATPAPIVLDADALFFLPHLRHRFPRPAPTVITPHRGELNRILEATGFPPCTDDNRIDSARAISREFGVITVLKGPHTVVCSENGDDIRINPTGSPALASGGSGDVLTGIIAALLPQLPSPLDAAAAGVYIHGLCAEVTWEKARRSIHADDLYQNLGMTLKKLSPFA